MNGKRARQVRRYRARRRERVVIHQPGPWAEAVDKASARDRAYFRARPDRTYYVRQRLPGEWGPGEGDKDVAGSKWTLVQKLPLSVRAKGRARRAMPAWWRPDLDPLPVLVFETRAELGGETLAVGADDVDETFYGYAPDD